jgi:hypothetical protein
MGMFCNEVRSMYFVHMTGEADEALVPCGTYTRCGRSEYQAQWSCGLRHGTIGP